MVIGSNPESQLKPFDENLKKAWVDKTAEYKEEYETKKVSTFYCKSGSSWGFRITKDLFDFIQTNKTGAITQYTVTKLDPFQYLQKGYKYRGYHTVEDGKRCKGDAWFEVVSVNETTHPDNNVCFEGKVTIKKISRPKKIALKDKYPDYNTYLRDWHGVEDITKQGYHHNPKAKWDWYQLGGLWSGLIKLKAGATGKVGQAGTFDNETGIDQAKKGDIANIDELKTFAVLKNGKWYEKGEMGWWGIVTDEKLESDWESEQKKLIEGLPDDTLISIYDCHI